MKKVMKAVAALMLMTAVVFAAGCKKESVSGSYEGHNYVDLGLPSGTLWATCNVGAETATDYGDLFSWGEVSTKADYTSQNYKWYKGDRKLTKYCNDPQYGFQDFTDNLTTLLSEDDAASANWGGGWYTPTYDQWNELIQNTTQSSKKQNGVDGFLFSAANGNTLFLPFAGASGNDMQWGAGETGFYWSSSLWTSVPRSAWFFICHDGGSNQMDAGHGRSNGFSVRPVRSTN